MPLCTLLGASGPQGAAQSGDTGGISLNHPWCLWLPSAGVEQGERCLTLCLELYTLTGPGELLFFNQAGFKNLAQVGGETPDPEYLMLPRGLRGAQSAPGSPWDRDGSQPSWCCCVFLWVLVAGSMQSRPCVIDNN